jgi:formylmethanofuran dehydrogenase subunit E
MITTPMKIKNAEEFCKIPGIDKIVENNMKNFSIVVCRNCGHKYDLIFAKNDTEGNPICPVCRE